MFTLKNAWRTKDQNRNNCCDNNLELTRQSEPEREYASYCSLWSLLIIKENRIWEMREINMKYLLSTLQSSFARLNRRPERRRWHRDQKSTWEMTWLPPKDRFRDWPSNVVRKCIHVLILLMFGNWGLTFTSTSSMIIIKTHSVFSTLLSSDRLYWKATSQQSLKRPYLSKWKVLPHLFLKSRGWHEALIVSLSSK